VIVLVGTNIGAFDIQSVLPEKIREPVAELLLREQALFNSCLDCHDRAHKTCINQSLNGFVCAGGDVHLFERFLLQWQSYRAVEIKEDRSKLFI
jgi:hypothetical protein